MSGRFLFPQNSLRAESAETLSAHGATAGQAVVIALTDKRVPGTSERRAP